MAAISFIITTTAIMVAEVIFHTIIIIHASPLHDKQHFYMKNNYIKIIT